MAGAGRQNLGFKRTAYQGQIPHQVQQLMAGHLVGKVQIHVVQDPFRFVDAHFGFIE